MTASPPGCSLSFCPYYSPQSLVRVSSPWSGSQTRPAGALTISTELATRGLSVAPSEDPPQGHVPLDLESAASSL